MKVLMVEPFVPPYMAEIDNSLESMQQAVGGFIEPAYFYDDVIIVCNDEGKINGSLPNRAIKDENGETLDVIYGTFFVCEDGGGDFKSISEDKARKYADLFSNRKARENQIKKDEAR